MGGVAQSGASAQRGILLREDAAADLPWK